MKKAIVNKDLCIGCGACQAIAPEIYEIESDGLAMAKLGTIPEELLEDAADAADGCPTGAIVIEEDKVERSAA